MLPIILLSIYPWMFDDINKNIANAHKCIVSWIVLEIEIEERDITRPCDYDKAIVLVQWDNKVYKVYWNKYPKSAIDCDGGVTIQSFSDETLPKIWDKVEYLAISDTIEYSILSTKKNWEWVYEFSNNNLNSLEWNFTSCEPNIPKEKELEIRKKGLNSYLTNLHKKTPRTAKSLQTALEKLNLSSFTQETNILVLYAREILKMLVENL
jgi:hypothetical protein